MEVYTQIVTSPRIAPHCLVNMNPIVVRGPVVSRQKRKIVKKCAIRIFRVLCEELSDVIEAEENKTKREWVRKWVGRREKLGVSALLLKELAVEDATEYRRFLRMTPGNFEDLLRMVSPSIQRQDTILRDAIPARVKLELTLNFLASGSSYSTLSHLFRVPKPSISKFLPEVLDAIYHSLQHYIKVSKISSF